MIFNIEWMIFRKIQKANEMKRIGHAYKFSKKNRHESMIVEWTERLNFNAFFNDLNFPYRRLNTST